jgi:heavy metal sensor kinase
VRLSSVRVWLVLWNIAVMALVLGAFGFALSFSVRAFLDDSIDQELAERAHAKASEWTQGGRSHVEPGPPGGFSFEEGTPRRSPPPGASERERHGFYWRPRLMNLDGQSMVPNLGDAPWDDAAFILSLAGQERYSTVPVEGETVRVFSAPLRFGEEIDGVVQVAHPLTDQRRLLDGLTRTLLMLIPLALVVSGVGGAFLTSRALRPVKKITEEAAQIGAHDLSRRLEVPGTDELSTLAGTFNAMIARLETAFHDMERAYEQQRRFTADASHELRTPLTTIKANTSLALCGEPTLEEYRETIEAADEAADTMNRIVQDLLLLARSDGGQLGLRAEPAPIRGILERAAGLVKDRERAPIVVDVADADLCVHGDPHHLLRLFVNLAENAARHTPPDGRVVLAARADGPSDTVQITVTDTGEGIPAEHLPHVCERFYRVDAARSRGRGGTGLGLSICQSIVSAHGGVMTIDSERGRGTTVSVVLPQAAAVAQPADLLSAS